MTQIRLLKKIPISQHCKFAVFHYLRSSSTLNKPILILTALNPDSLKDNASFAAATALAVTSMVDGSVES